eukprot:SAG31_NODE_4066_length_3623_cov_2.164302_6_plen_43_part_00
MEPWQAAGRVAAHSDAPAGVGKHKSRLVEGRASYLEPTLKIV